MPELLGMLRPSLPSTLETPETEPDDDFVDCLIRPITPEDMHFLWELPVKPPARDVLLQPEIRRYLQDWVNLTIPGFVALDPVASHPIVAVWLRFLIRRLSMIDRFQYERAVERSSAMLREAALAITPSERERFEVADFGLNELEKTGLQIITYVNTDRCCAKEIIMTPGQTCPEHQHPTISGVPGKEETFRCRWGTVYLYVPGSPSSPASCVPPGGSEPYYTVYREICLKPGDQYTLVPDTLHWFQAGPEGAIVSEFSTRSTDEADVFTDPRIKRAPEVA